MSTADDQSKFSSSQRAKAQVQANIDDRLRHADYGPPTPYPTLLNVTRTDVYDAFEWLHANPDRYPWTATVRERLRYTLSQYPDTTGITDDVALLINMVLTTQHVTPPTYTDYADELINQMRSLITLLQQSTVATDDSYDTPLDKLQLYQARILRNLIASLYTILQDVLDYLVRQ